MTSESGLQRLPRYSPAHPEPRDARLPLQVASGLLPPPAGLGRPRAGRARTWRGRPPASPPRSCEPGPAASGAAGVPESRDQSRALTGASRAHPPGPGPPRRRSRAAARSSADQLRSRFRVSSGAPGRPPGARQGPLGPAHRPPGPPLPARPLSRRARQPFGSRRSFARPRSGDQGRAPRAQGRGAGRGRAGAEARGPSAPSRPPGARPLGAGTSGAGEGKSGPGATPVPGRCPAILKVTSGCLKSGFDFLGALAGHPPTR